MPEADIGDGWRRALAGADLPAAMAFARAERARGARIHPPDGQVLRAFALTPLERVRVVILGQDPYHGAGQAEGLAFSVPPGTPTPPSLRNIYRELGADLGLPPPRHGHLGAWARRGVLLLNAVLTVAEGAAGSHRGRGWEAVTDAAVAAVDALPRPVVFLLWGARAQAKAGFVDATRHLALRAAHPSPLSAHAGFFGCRHFSQANGFLTARGLAPIDWRLPDEA